MYADVLLCAFPCNLLRGDPAVVTTVSGKRRASGFPAAAARSPADQQISEVGPRVRGVTEILVKAEDLTWLKR